MAEPEIEAAVASAAPRLGESRWRSTDHALRELQQIAEKYIESNRRTRNLLALREGELLELRGPCPDAGCRLHQDHAGPCFSAEDSNAAP